MTGQASLTTGPSPAGVKDRRFLLLPVILSATFMQLIDVSIVNVAIPSIQASLTASFAAVELMVSVYLLAFAVTLITGGRMGDIFGRRRLFLIGMAGFTIASVICGAAPTATVLVVARIFQGLNIAGLSWRLIFFVNVPIGVAAFAGAVRALPESTAPDTLRLDLAGAGLATVGLGLLVYPLVEGRRQSWPVWLVILLALSVPALAAFALLQRHTSARNGHPLIRWSLFHQRSFVAGSVLSLAFFLGVAPFFFVFSIYLHTGLGFSALATGLTVLAFAVGSGIASYRSAGIAKRLGRGAHPGRRADGSRYDLRYRHHPPDRAHRERLRADPVALGRRDRPGRSPLTSIVLAGVARSTPVAPRVPCPLRSSWAGPSGSPSSGYSSSAFSTLTPTTRRPPPSPICGPS